MKLESTAGKVLVFDSLIHKVVYLTLNRSAICPVVLLWFQLTHLRYIYENMLSIV